MKNLSLVNFFVVGFTATLIVSCSSSKISRSLIKPLPIVAANPILPVKANTTATDLAAMGPTGSGGGGVDVISDDNLRQRIEKDERSVFFDYNKYNVQQGYGDFFDIVFNEVRSKQISGIRVEGNTDIRGSRAYNMALGQQRAESVRGFLVSKGVPKGVVQTISYGKERPLASGVDEESHAINRRADILYSGEY